MILTVTLNAAIDKRYVVDDFKVGEVNRVRECTYVPGGKGLNVSKPASIYGAEVVATGFVGGHAGNYIEAALKPFGIKSAFYHVDAESRSCINIWDEVNHVQTEFLEPGFTLTEADFEGFEKKFRQLVKDLAAIFKTRIELRQIGVRDETKILGGIGICGRCLCCHTYLSEFAPVSIKMAKEQNLSLNQTKISGVCGRLMCCLKNEQETYEELNKKLPGLGDTVTTPDGLQGTVQSVNVLRQRVKVIVEINDEKEIQEFPVDELKFRPRKKKVKVSDKELKELGNLEDKKGDSKLND